MSDTEKYELREASYNYVDGHEDPEVRRMHGHHCRTFVAGAIWENERKSDRFKSLDNCLKMINEAVNDGIEIEKGDPIHKKIIELLKP